MIPDNKQMHHKVLRTGPIKKLKTDLTWITRAMTLSTENLSFSYTMTVKDPANCGTEQEFLDVIPLHQITEVRASSTAGSSHRAWNAMLGSYSSDKACSATSEQDLSGLGLPPPSSSSSASAMRCPLLI